jgi:hypothetical protein
MTFKKKEGENKAMQIGVLRIHDILLWIRIRIRIYTSD